MAATTIGRAGQAIGRFERALRKFRESLSPEPGVFSAVFEGREDWYDLLIYKLAPHLADEGCLVVAVAGGTNTGKSTIYNMLLGQILSPIVNTAAATCHPVLAASESRAKECLESKLVPEFACVALDDPAQATDASLASETLLVARVDALPRSLVIMDTPDIDSIDKRNWAIAEHLRAAGDVLIAVLTGEKYKDERVVSFFREAVSSGRVVIPLMNKANPDREYAVARQQLDEFREDTGTQEPPFVLNHDFDIATDLDRAIQSPDGERELRAYLTTLDTPTIKERVYQGTIARFAEESAAFLDAARGVADGLREAVDLFQELADAAAREYNPAPGKAMGGLFHEFVQAKRGTIRRTIGNASTAIVRGASSIGRGIVSGFRKRATLEVEEKETEEALVQFHRNALEQITNNLAKRYVETARALPEPARALAAKAFDDLDVDAVVNRVRQDVLIAENISDAFREHANAMLETWWEDHRGKRMTLEAMDTILAIMPAAIAGVTTLVTSGFGAGEIALASTAAGAAFGAKVMEYQFGDAMFDFLSPWREEQQAALREALLEHLTQPGLGRLHAAADCFGSEALDELSAALAGIQQPGAAV